MALHPVTQAHGDSDDDMPELASPGSCWGVNSAVSEATNGAVAAFAAQSHPTSEQELALLDAQKHAPAVGGVSLALQ